jgi:sugar/nucleoside kinase (ribokinase family)
VTIALRPAAAQGSYTARVSAAPGPDVVGLGTNSADTVLRVPHLPADRGAFTKIRVTEKSVCMGGQTATAMAACASFGLRASYVGAIGSDDNGRRMRQELQRRGVDLRHSVRRDVPNHFAHILVDETTGARIVIWGRDAALDLRGDEIPDAVIRSSRLLHVDDVDAAGAVRAAQIARAAGIPVTSDIDRPGDQVEELLSAVTVPIFAEHIPEQLTGMRDPERALRLMRDRHHGLLCVTLGEAGAMALSGDEIIYEPGVRVQAVDTTGAGDVFRGGFIYGFLQGWEVARVLRFANAAAAASCTRLGAMNGVPSLGEVESLLAQRV